MYLGFCNFPHGLAEAQKIILISKALIQEGNCVTVICRNGRYNKDEKPELKAEDVYQGIKYKYVSGSCFRNDSFFKRRLLEVKGRINEVTYLRRLAKEENLDYAIISSKVFSSIFLYYLLSKVLKFKTILNYVEYCSAFKKNRFQIKKRINDQLLDQSAPRLCDAIFPISEFLINHLKKLSPSKPFLKIPGLTDFEKYNGVEVRKNEKYFMYCGSAAYAEIILFTLDSFDLINNSSSFFLYLVINGDETEMKVIEEHIQKKKRKDKIKVFCKLSDKELYALYYGAEALLIPLRPTLRDIARFPHKTGEYLASGNPVISTKYGEIEYYFTDMVNMLLAETYDVNLFAEKMQYVIDNPSDAQKIGLQGKKIATDLFDYRYQAKNINNFLDAELN